MSLEDLTVERLRQIAHDEEVNLHGASTKADIIKHLEEAGIESEEDVIAEPAPKAKEEAPAKDEEPEATEYRVKLKPEMDDEAAAALAARNAKQDANPIFRRQEWFRYKKLGGKNAPWRRPRGIHSKMRRHYKYRPAIVRIGYRTPNSARGLHPSGFEEVLVYRPDDLDELDKATQAARIGGTVGGRKQAAIVSKADELGIRVLNRGGN